MKIGAPFLYQNSPDQVSGLALLAVMHWIVDITISEAECKFQGDRGIPRRGTDRPKRRRMVCPKF